MSPRIDSQLPKPFTPSNADLTRLPCMMLPLARLRADREWMLAKRNPARAFALLNLFMTAYMSKPAGSLEDNDLMLADAAGVSDSEWQTIRSDILSGWSKCSDGRLYHPLLADIVNDAWNGRLAHVAKTQAGRDTIAKNKASAKSVTKPVTESVTESVTDRKYIPTDIPTDLPIDPNSLKHTRVLPDGSTPHRLPSDWAPSSADRTLARRLGYLDRDIDHQLVPGFRKRWHEARGQDGRRKNWPTVWKNWCEHPRQLNGQTRQAA